MSRHYYYDKATRQMVEGYAPPAVEFPMYGQAPMVIFDDMPPLRHPLTGEVITSRKYWETTDKVTGCHTTGTKPETPKRPDRSSEVKADIDQAMQRAVWALDNGMAPLTEKQRADFKRQNEIIKSQTGVDMTAPVGREARKKKQ